MIRHGSPLRSKLDNRSSRLKLPIRRRVYTAPIERGLRIGYRRLTTDGTWSIVRADGHGGYWIEKLDGVVADDFQEADGVRVLSYWQGAERIRKAVFGEGQTVNSTDKPTIVDRAIDSYAADLKAREGGAANATWLRHRLPKTLRSKVLALVDAREFRKWRDDLVESGELERSTINRVMKAAKACFNHAAALDERIGNKDAWTTGLKALPGADKSRNVVITEAEVRAIVAACYDISPELGLFAEVGACTGARPSQIANLTCSDAQTDRLLMPSSRKGRGRREVTRKPIPIPPSLAARLLVPGIPAG